MKTYKTYQARNAVKAAEVTNHIKARKKEGVTHEEAKAEAYQEISLDSEKESLEKKFKELEDTPPDIETELLELKKRAALPSPEDNNSSSDK